MKKIILTITIALTTALLTITTAIAQKIEPFELKDSKAFCGTNTQQTGNFIEMLVNAGFTMTANYTDQNGLISKIYENHESKEWILFVHNPDNDRICILIRGKSNE